MSRRFLLVVVLVTVVLLGAVVVIVGNQIRELGTVTQDALIFDSQQEIIDEVSTSSDCDHIRARLAEAQGILAASSPDPLTVPAARRLSEVAQQQLDTMRCGG